MSSYKFLLAPPPRVLVDIETLFDVYTAVLDCHEKEHGTRTPPTWLGSEFPILRNVSPKYGKRIAPYFKKVPLVLNPSMKPRVLHIPGSFSEYRS
jgi:hypothetical protein